MTRLWLPGAEKISGDHDAGLPMWGDGGHYATHHITVTAPGSYAGARAALLSQGTEPCLLIDPTNNRRGQFFPANRGGYALVNAPGGIETNRLGDIHVQIEWVWDRMDRDMDKAPHFDECWHDVVEFLRDLGIPDHWPFGFKSTAKTASKQRISGHRGHVNWLENNHYDNLATAKQPTWPGAFGPLTDDERATTLLLTRKLSRHVDPLPQGDRELLRHMEKASAQARALRRHP